MFLGGNFHCWSKKYQETHKKFHKTNGKKCYTEDTDNLGSCSHLVMVKIAASDVLRWYKLLADLKNQNRNPFWDQIPFAFKTCLQKKSRLEEKEEELKWRANILLKSQFGWEGRSIFSRRPSIWLFHFTTPICVPSFAPVSGLVISQGVC